MDEQSYYKNWYEKNKEKHKIWSRNYYQKNKDRIRRVHKIWEQKKVDTGGSIWRKYNHWRRIRNPNFDKEQYQKYRERILAQKKLYYRKKVGMMYKPLPESVTIKPSGIDGLGLFAKEDMAQGTNLGMCHLKIGKTIFRTPLGGFINHANDGNCVKAELRMTDEDLQGHKYDYKKWNLITSRDVKAGDELTVRYTFYNV